MNVVRILVIATFLASEKTSSGGQGRVETQESRRCNGSVTATVAYEDGEIIKALLNGRDPVSSYFVTRFASANFLSFTGRESSAGENGITITQDGHRILLFPGGNSGQYVVHAFNYSSNSTSIITVYCQPVSLAYRPGYQRAGDSIVGHCTLNTTLMCFLYFKLGVRSGRWTDISRSGYCSRQLVTTNLTNPVILQYENDYDPYVTKLYIAEQGTNRLHEIDLGQQEVDIYMLPNGNQIHHLVPAFNSTFSGLRVVFSDGNPSGYYHRYFSPETGLTDVIFHTNFVVFNSYNLDYLVTFANHDTLSIIKQDRTLKQFPLNISLDDPIRCQNMAVGLNTHYLVCLTDGLHPVIINITKQVTCYTIPVDDPPIVRVGMVTGDVFYLVTEKREILFYYVSSTVVCLGSYALRDANNYEVINSTSDLSCDNAPDNVNTVTHKTDKLIFLTLLVVPVLVAVLVAVVAVGLFLFKWRYKKDSDCDSISHPHPLENSSAGNVTDGLTSNHITNPGSFGNVSNNERLVIGNLVPQKDTSATTVISAEVHNNCIQPLKASAENIDFAKRNRELDSNRSVQFEQGESIQVAEDCTQKNTSKPPQVFSDVQRDKL